MSVFRLRSTPSKRRAFFQLGCDLQLTRQGEDKVLQSWNGHELAIYGPDDFEYRDLLCDDVSGFLLVSQRLQRLLDKLYPREVDVYGVQLQRADGTQAHRDFVLIKPHCVLDCLDTSRTAGRWEQFDGREVFCPEDELLSGMPIAVHMARIQQDVFRILGCGDHMYVTARVVDALRSANVTGALFEVIRC